jgi:hypothetical protein
MPLDMVPPLMKFRRKGKANEDRSILASGLGSGKGKEEEGSN